MSTNTSLDSNIFLTSFLEGTLGVDGYQAFVSTLKKDEKLLNAVIGRSLWAWVQTLPVFYKGNFDSNLPGMSGTAVLKKSENGHYNGYLNVNNISYKIADADSYQLAATLSVALGQNNLTVPSGVRKEVLSKLGKSVDLLVKSRYLGIAKSHKKVFKKNAIEKKVLDPSLGYKIHADHHDLGDGRTMTKVHALSPSGEHVGSASFLHVGDSLVPGTVVVHDDHQRQGLASAMYNHAQTATKKLIKPSSNQTDEGQALWMGNKLNPQFGAQVSKSLAILEKRFLGAYFTDIKKALPDDEKQVLEDHLRELGFSDYNHNPTLGATKFDILTDARGIPDSIATRTRNEPASQLFETFEGPHRHGLSNHGLGITSQQRDHGYWSSLGQEVGLNKGVPPAALHSSLEGFFGQLKTLPHEGPVRGNFITAHLNHAPFVAALQAHPQGQKMANTLNSFVNSKANAGFTAGATKVTAKKESKTLGLPLEETLVKAKTDPTNTQVAADMSGNSPENQMLQGAVDGAKKQKFINAFLAPEPWVDRRSRLLNEAMDPNSRLIQTFKDYHQPFEGRPASHVYYHPGSAEFTTHHQALNGPELTAKHAWMTSNHPGQNDRRWLHFPPGQDSPDFISHDEHGQLYYHKNFKDWAKGLNPIAVDLNDQSSLLNRDVGLPDRSEPTKAWENFINRVKLTKSLPKSPEHNQELVEHDAVLKDKFLGEGQVHTAANPAAELRTEHHMFDGSSMPMQVSIENREAAFARDPRDVNVSVEPHAQAMFRAPVEVNTNTEGDKYNEHRFWNALRTSLKGIRMSAGGKALLPIAKKDLMPGGKGDNIPDDKFKADQLAAGVKVESEEHGLDPQRAKEVAKDHLAEDPNYYSKLKTMEKAWPTDAESKANAESHAVLHDSLEEKGAQAVDPRRVQGDLIAKSPYNKLSSEQDRQYYLDRLSTTALNQDNRMGRPNPWTRDSPARGGLAYGTFDPNHPSDVRADHDFWSQLNEDDSHLLKAWPKDETENKTNMESDAVLKDHLLGHGTVATTDTVPYVNPVQVSGKGTIKTIGRIDQAENSNNINARSSGGYNYPREPADNENLTTTKGKSYGEKVGDTVEPRFQVNTTPHQLDAQWADKAFWSNVDTHSSDLAVPPYTDSEGLNYTIIHNNYRNDKDYDPNHQDAWDFRVRVREGNDEFAGTSRLYKLRDLWSDDIHDDPTLNEGVINHLRANYPKELIPTDLQPHVDLFNKEHSVKKVELPGQSHKPTKQLEPIGPTAPTLVQPSNKLKRPDGSNGSNNG